MNKAFLLGFGLLSLAQPALAERQDLFSQKFNHLLYHPYVHYHDGRLDILYKLSWGEMFALGLCGSIGTALAIASRDNVGRVLGGVMAAGFFGSALYKAWKVHSKVPCLTFSPQGLQTESTWLFNWSQVEKIEIEEVFNQVYAGHAFQPLDSYQFQTGNIENQYAGRRLVCFGKHKTRLWSIDERTHWMPIALNELIDLLNFFKEQYGR